VEGQPLAAVQDDVLARVELDLAAGGKAEPAGLADAGDQGRGGRRVHRFRQLPGQPEDDRLDAAVAVPGRAQRAEQLRPDPGHPVLHAVLGERGGEHARGAHRSHRVRARRPDADFEEVEGADGHVGAPAAGRPITDFRHPNRHNLDGDHDESP
jgi:hypothetical protein